MTREEAESRIAELVKQAYDIAVEYGTKGSLHLAAFKSGSILFNNARWEGGVDEACQLDYFKSGEEPQDV